MGDETERTLRPQYLREYTGRIRSRDQLKSLSKLANAGWSAGPCALIWASRSGKRPWPLSRFHELGSNLKQTSGPARWKADCAILNDLNLETSFYWRFIAPCRWKRCFIVPWKTSHIDIMIGADRKAVAVFIWTCHHSPWLGPWHVRAKSCGQCFFGITGHMEYYAHADLTDCWVTADIESDGNHPWGSFDLRSRGTLVSLIAPSSACVTCADYGRWLGLMMSLRIRPWLCWM